MDTGVLPQHYTIRDTSEPQDGTEAYEGAGTGLLCQSQEISLLQRRSGQDCTESTEQKLLCRKTQSEVGHRCNGIQLIWSKTLPFSNLGFAQWLSSQLYHFRPTGSEHGNSHAHQSFCNHTNGTGLILHSDQGWQYQHKQYQQILKAKGIRQSMSRKGTAWTMLSWKISLVYSKVSCFICKSSDLRITSSRNWWTISITTIIAESR